MQASLESPITHFSGVYMGGFLNFGLWFFFGREGAQPRFGQGSMARLGALSLVILTLGDRSPANDPSPHSAKGPLSREGSNTRPFIRLHQWSLHVFCFGGGGGGLVLVVIELCSVGLPYGWPTCPHAGPGFPLGLAAKGVPLLCFPFKNKA